DNVIIADYTKLDREWSLDELLHMTQAQRDQIEWRVAREIADALMERLPTNDAACKALLGTGQMLMKRLGWDHVLETKLIPLLRVLSAEASADRLGGERQQALVRQA